MTRKRTGNSFAPRRGEGGYPEHMLCPTTGKVKYRKIETAERALAQIILHGRYPARRVYLCPHCDRYHITSRERPAAE